MPTWQGGRVSDEALRRLERQAQAHPEDLAAGWAHFRAFDDRG